MIKIIMDMMEKPQLLNFDICRNYFMVIDHLTCFEVISGISIQLFSNLMFDISFQA